MFKRENQTELTHAQLIRRLLLLGGIAVVCFLAIFFRLWYLGVLSGDRYLEQAQGNQIRAITIQAPRGNILDRNGEPLVSNRTALALRIHDDQLPERGSPERQQVLRDLGRVINMKPKEIRKRMAEKLKVAPASPVVLRHDIPHETVYYLREHAAAFPGVSVDRVYVREYPKDTLASHVLGYPREVTAEQLEDARFENAKPGDSVGQDGVELTYDNELRGVNGATRIQVDAHGRPTGEAVANLDPTPGNDLYLSIDSELQQTGEQAISRTGLPSSFVAMDVKSGEVLALGSFPTYQPSIFAKPVVTEAEAEQLYGSVGGSYAPIFNRAISGGYPIASTIKPFTAIAALRDKNLKVNEIINDDGLYELGELKLRNAGEAAYGPIDLRDSLKFSSDIFYYTLGDRMDQSGNQALQKTLSDFGFGAPTGIDVPSESGGLVPTPEWRQQLYEDGLTDRPWSVGDNVNLSIGQGDLQADVLQLAVAYAAIGNGGDVVTPHVGLRIASPEGRVIREIAPRPKRHINIREAWRDAILDGLRGVTTEPGGTAYGIFGGWPIQVAGKTGTAERPPHGDQAWFVALAPADDPEIVVALTIEQGGFGSETAAPAVAEILRDYFDIDPKDIVNVQADSVISE